jgi:hypothetical protein
VLIGRLYASVNGKPRPAVRANIETHASVATPTSNMNTT